MKLLSRINKLPLFPVQLYWKDWTGDIDGIAKLIKDDEVKNPGPNNDSGMTITQARSGSNAIHLSEEPLYKELFGFIQGCLDDIWRQEKFQCDGFKICSSWSNIYYPNTSLNYHQHPMSAFSGAFFVKGEAPLTFMDPIMPRRNPSLMPISPDNDIASFSLTSVPGRVVIFPHWLEHGVSNYSYDISSITSTPAQERISISFNSLPYGKINHRDGLNLSSAELNVLTSQEQNG